MRNCCGALCPRFAVVFFGLCEGVLVTGYEGVMKVGGVLVLDGGVLSLSISGFRRVDSHFRTYPNGV